MLWNPQEHSDDCVQRGRLSKVWERSICKATRVMPGAHAGLRRGLSLPARLTTEKLMHRALERPFGKVLPWKISTRLRTAPAAQNRP